MKPVLATITVAAVFPAGHVPSGMTLPDFAYRAATGLCLLESMTAKLRPLTRDETHRHAEFLLDWDQNLAAWERANGSETSGPVRRAVNLNKEIGVEPDNAATVADTSRLLFTDPLGGEWSIDNEGPSEVHVHRTDRAGRPAYVGTFFDLPIAVAFLQSQGCVAKGGAK